MTAVEWLVNELRKPEADNYALEIIKQALEMEKEQIKSAFMQGDIFGADYFDGINPTDENYYNQTYKK